MIVQSLLELFFLQIDSYAGDLFVEIQLAQAFEQFLMLTQLFEESSAVYDEALAQAWLVDKKLFAIASGARQARTDKAMTWLKTKAEG